MLETSKNIFFGISLGAVCLVVLKGLVLVFAFLVNVFLFPDYSDTTNEYSHTVEIQSLKDNNVYVIGRNSSNSHQNFYYLEERDGKIFSRYFSAADSALIETEEKPHIKVYKKVPVELSPLWVWSESVVNFHSPRHFYEFYIPEGSIEMEFTIDQE